MARRTTRNCSELKTADALALIGRLGQNAEAKTAQNNNEFVILNVATQEIWKNDKGDYENRTEWHRVAWRKLSKFARTLQGHHTRRQKSYAKQWKIFL